MLLDCYAEILYFVMSTPIIYILYISSLITKETTKRQRDRIYCKNDIMEMETMRYYASNGERKNQLRNIHIAAGIFITVIILILFINFFITDVNDSMETLIIFFILLILASFLIYNIRGLVSQSTPEYDTTMADLKKYLRKVLRGEEKDSSNAAFVSFSKLPDTFLIPFVERWLFMENINDIKTFKKRVDDIDVGYANFIDDISVNKLIGLMRPYEKDIKYLYEAVRSSQKPSLPDVNEYENAYRNITFLEIIAWIILVFIYYNIFHIYYLDTDMFVEIITAIIISILLITIMYYLIIAKNAL